MFEYSTANLGLQTEADKQSSIVPTVTSLLAHQRRKAEKG